MRKAQIHFSNSLEELGERIKKSLFFENRHPFARKVIIVPHPQIKTFLMHSFVEDEQIQIAAGIQVITLSQAMEKITGKEFPSKTLLTLFIEYAIMPMIETEKELQEYFKHPAYTQRIGPFCENLTNLFMEQGINGNKILLPWQQNLWDQIKQKWTFPIQLSELQFSTEDQLHLFGFSYLPNSYLDFFHAQQARCYFLSPCQVFWADYISEKKQIILEKQLSKNAQEDFLKSFEDQNFLLAHWGRLGQKILSEIEERNFQVEECYVLPTDNRYLQQLQRDLLDGYLSTGSFDESIQCFSTPSKLREMEVLKEQFLKLMEEKSILPNEIQVFAPNINEYVGYIHAVFGQVEPTIPYSINGLEIQSEDPFAKALVLLLKLIKERFSVDAIFSFLHAPLVMQRLDLTIEELHLFRYWIEAANVDWGLSIEQRQKLLEREMPGISVQHSPTGTWQSGFIRLIFGLGQIDGDGFPLSIVETTQIEILEKFFQIIEKLEIDLIPLVEQIPQTIPKWIEMILALLDQYISEEHSHEIFRDLVHLLKETGDLEDRKISFASFERVLQQLLSKKNQAYLVPHLQAIHFASLATGCSKPSKVIHILGMQENAFPRKDHIISKETEINQIQKDQYLFLELLLNARQYFSVSFQTSEEKEPSILVSQLLSQGKGARIQEYSSLAFDPVNFVDQSKFTSLHYFTAKSSLRSLQKTPLIPEFYETYSLTLPKCTQSLTIDFRLLAKLAKHPLRFFFHEILKIYPEYEESKYLISSKIKKQLVKEALHIPIEEVFQKAEQEGKIPKNAFRSVMQTQIIDEVEDWKSCLKSFHLSPEDIGALEFQPYCKFPKKHPDGTWIYPALSFQLDGHEVRIIGRIENWTKQGLIVNGEETLENLVAFWPYYLILKYLGIGSLIFVKDQKQVSIEIADGTLENYLRYFFLASTCPSPLIPPFVKPLLNGNSDDLDKALKNNTHDEILNWLIQRDLQPNAGFIYQNWSEILKKVFFL